MSLTDEIEQKGIDVTKLSTDEQQTYFTMLEAVQNAQLTPEKLREYIIAMRSAVEQELINEPEFIRVFIFKFENRKQILLKARLQNYMLLEAFLISPQIAQKRLEDMIKNFVGK